MHILFDIGGTNIRVARSRDGEIDAVAKEKTEKEPGAALAQIVRMARAVAETQAITTVTGGMPGIVRNGTVTWEPPHLSGWKGMEIASTLEKELGAHVLFANDTGVVGLGEAMRGAGKGAGSIVYMTVSTGVNAARIQDGGIEMLGFEIGHQLVNGKTLEEQVSGTAVRRKFNIEPKDLESLDEREKLADILATGLYNTLLHWSPERIVLGGSMIVGINPIPLERVQSTLTALCTDLRIDPPPVVMAELGDNGGLYGASYLIRDAH